MNPSIRHITRQELDTAAYDKLVEATPGGNIYSYSFYLDHMAGNWDVLVMGDYEAALPLPWRRKYGVKYLYMPAFTPMLSVCGKNEAEALTGAFLEAVPQTFRFWELSLRNVPPSWQYAPRTNYVLPLGKNYQALYAQYRENIRRNCRKAAQLGCTIHRDLPVAEVIAIAREQLQPISNIAGQDLAHFETLYNLLRSRNMAATYGVRDASGNLLASCAFFFSHGRAYYILVGNHPNGRTLGASHALIDAFIKDHAGEPLLLDFEGSDIRNLAFFYSSFGSEQERYHQVKLNRLPWWMKLFKK